MLTSSELFNRISSQLGDSKAEPQSDRGIEVVALEKGEGQSVIHLREHDPKIETPLWCKPPIDSGRDRVERPGALRVLGAEARGGPPGGGAEKRILDIMVTVLPSYQGACFCKEGSNRRRITNKLIKLEKFTPVRCPLEAVVATNALLIGLSHES